MNYSIEPIPALNDNYIWLLKNSHQCLIVDPGEAAPVFKTLKQQKLTLTGILNTHHHWDHTDGIAELVEAFDVPVYGPASNETGDITHGLNDGDVLELPELGTRFRILSVPGHTLDHTAFVDDHNLFSGDTLFTAGCGRLFEGTPAQMLSSLKQLKALPESTLVYCGHEYTEANLRFARAVEPDSQAIAKRIADVARLRQAGTPTVPAPLSVELATNPFLRTDQPTVIAAAQEQAGKLVDEVAVFATIRQWKDTF